MSAVGSPDQFFIGWDVGGWNCDKNPASRDAIVILDADRNPVGDPWRGNLRTTINEADTSRRWLQALFAHCQADWPAGNMQVVLAIDTPLGFSEAFTRLVARLECEEPIEQSAANPYLFRRTERILFEHGLKPLSPIKDMIGSQATKGIHVLAKFAPTVAQCGVWTDEATLTAIEAYPSACKGSSLFQELLGRYLDAEPLDPAGTLRSEPFDHEDKRDALICALVAHTFSFHTDALAHPSDWIPKTEGWIWVPMDVLRPIGRGRTLLLS